MNPQVPSIASISSAIVLLSSMFLDIELVTEEVQAVINAIAVLILTGASIWSWVKTRGLIRENASLTAKVAKFSISAPKKKSK